MKRTIVYFKIYVILFLAFITLKMIAYNIPGGGVSFKTILKNLII